MKQIKILMISMLVFGFKTSAQESEKKTYSYSLDQAITHALEYSTEAINSDRDIKEAKMRKWEATADGLPQVDAQVGYLNNVRLQQSPLPESFGAGPVGAFGVKHNMDANITINQLLLNSSFIVVLRLAKVYLSYAELNQLKTKSDIREMITNTYGNVLLVEESLKVLESNRVSLESNYKEMAETYKNGLTEEENVEQLEITLASINNTLKYNQKLKESAYKMLKLSLGMELEDELVLVDDLETLTQKNIKLDLMEDTFDITQNIDYQLVDSNEENERLFYKLEKTRRYPSLVSFAKLGANSFSATDFSFTQSSQKYYDYSSFGVQLNVPIFSSYKSGARIQQYKIKYEKAKTLKKDTTDKLQVAWENAKSDYQYSIDQYQTAQKILGLAARIESKQQVKFKEGMSTSFEFTEAQRQLYSEQQNYLKAMLEVINKRAALEKIVNKQ